MGKGLFISSESGGRANAALSGVLREVCRLVDEKNFDVARYSADITDIGIIVNCFPDDLMAAGFGKPRIMLRYKQGSADIRLPMPYVDFINADEDTRFLMAVKNITESVAVIGERCAKSRRAKFDSEGMITEILRLTGIERGALEDVDGVSGK